MCVISLAFSIQRKKGEPPPKVAKFYSDDHGRHRLTISTWGPYYRRMLPHPVQSFRISPTYHTLPYQKSNEQFEELD